MPASSNQILTVAQMQAAEQALIDGGETVSTLMETAGAGAADWVWRIAGGRGVTVLCGPGNNGGDGYVIARTLAERGLAVDVVAPIEPKTDAAVAARKAWGGEPVAHGRHGVLVDSLFGSGLTRPLGDDLLGLLQGLASEHPYRVAIDLPSGIESDSGALLNDGLPHYDLTVALGAWKFAHWSMPGMAHLGERRLVDIGVSEVEGAAGLAAQPRFVPPAIDTHKYRRGLLAVVAGQMPGATMLATRAAMHGGAGYVKLFSDQEPGNIPADLVVVSDRLDEALADRRIDAVLVGPGLGRNEEAGDRLRKVLSCDRPAVLDADALIVLARDDLAGRDAPLIVTPHAGEFATLCETFAVDGKTRRERIGMLARKMAAIVVAKGPDTMVGTPDGTLTILPHATSWLSTAGTGDVLAGLIASRLAMGLAPGRAAVEGAWLHGAAARRSGAVFTSGDLVDHIADAYAGLL